jgi:hypothetical protein
VNLKCHATIRIKEEICEEFGKHDEEPDFVKNEIMEVIFNISERAKETTEKAKDIIARFIKNKSNEVLVRLPKLKSLVDKVTKIRTKFSVQTTLQLPAMNEYLTLTQSVQKFLLYDNKKKKQNFNICYRGQYFTPEKFVGLDL